MREVIDTALRRISVLAGTETAAAHEVAIGLRVSQQLVDDMSARSLARFVDVPVNVSVTATPETRVIKTAAGLVVTLPRLNADGSAIRDGAMVSVVDQIAGVGHMHRYDAETGQWSALDGLTVTSRFPFGKKHGHGFCAMLALRLCEDFGQPPSGALVQDAAVARKAIASSLNTAREPVVATYF
ncbi:MAG: hypothetical protein ACRC56_11895 [Bosea sp. (in: a-proteobacteria)]